MLSYRHRDKGAASDIASYQRSSFAAFVFVRKVLSKCTNKQVILVDIDSWYPFALERYGLLKWLHITFRQRNSIERFFRTFKGRTKRFYNNINSKNKIKCLSIFLNLFSLWYNHLRWHQGIRRIPRGELVI